MDLLHKNETLKDGSVWNFTGKLDYVDQWFLMKTPLPMIFLTASYLSFVLKLGPKYMESRKPFKLTTVITVYNILQVAYSCALLYIGHNLISTYGLLSSSCLMEAEDTKWKVTTSIYYYFFAKVTELMDTIFFVLRKKYNQVTFLHIYHHSLMMWGSWVSLKYEPSYGTIFLGTLNSFVHIIMYTYYALSAFPDLSKYLWWKKYITMMQLIQFMCIIVHAAASQFFSGCPPSYTLLMTIMLNAALFIYLFGQFYINSYRNTQKLSEKKILSDNCTQRKIDTKVD
ncbi:Elongation of very long chain fatty acids protein 7 [Papilio xuthus]|uniref:Elongation of very long chain fatty acids protein n=1 Tax=Papilio xuthus TaxID=66420 RepID=A0A194PYL9_PAPXU|nr:Elongation of very long chain fatty acids protein 7 [Papilio xuthus]